ncbi:MAG TPA: hypothetical protein VGP09_10215, partial [Caballeronia sp.]|nr:hypothetical protein [Caballeronia sp.]
PQIDTSGRLFCALISVGGQRVLNAPVRLWIIPQRPGHFLDSAQQKSSLKPVSTVFLRVRSTRLNLHALGQTRGYSVA